MSQAGRWDTVVGTWVVDAVTSPCIDAGDPNAAWDMEVQCPEGVTAGPGPGPYTAVFTDMEAFWIAKQFVL